MMEKFYDEILKACGAIPSIYFSPMPAASAIAANDEVKFYRVHRRIRVRRRKFNQNFEVRSLDRCGFCSDQSSQAARLNCRNYRR